MKKQTQFSMGAIALIVIAIVVLIVAEQRGDGSSDTDKVLVRDYSPLLGDKDAKVTIVEFFDPVCETCKSFGKNRVREQLFVISAAANMMT